MRISPKIFPIAVFVLVVGVSVGLFVFPEFMYQILLWVLMAFQAGGLPVLFFAMIGQALAVPIPSEVILLCGGAAFGLIAGWLVGAMGSVVAASISFYISRKGGRPIAIRFVSESGMEFANNWFDRWGSWAVILGRLLPVIPFDLISYSAGLTRMKFRDFVIPTVIGTFPRALFYAFLGFSFSEKFEGLVEYYKEHHEVPTELGETMFTFNLILLAIVMVIAAILIIYWVVMRRYMARQRREST